MIRFLENSNPKRTILFICLIFVPLFFFFLGIPHLWDGDESYYAEVSHQMLIRNDWIAPYFNYTSPSFDKPPFTFWVNLTCYKIFGMNEFASRFGSALFALFGIILVYLFGKRLFNKRTGILAALMLGTGFGYFVESQMVLIDTTLTFFIAATLYCFYRGYMDGKPSYLLIMGIPIGLGILTKGPVALLLSGGAGLVFWFYMTLKEKKKSAQLFNWQLLGGFLIAAAICLPWYLAMWFRFKEAFLAAHFGYHMFTRFTTSIESHGGSQWYFYLYYLVFLIIGFLPWSANLVGALKMGISRRGDQRTLFLLIWTALVFIFFTIARTKLPGYVIPLLPPVALLVASWWDQILADEQIKVNFWWGILCQLAGSLFLLIFMLVMHGKVPAGYESLYKAILLIPFSLIIASLITAILFWRSRNRQILFQATLVTFYLFWIFLYLTLSQQARFFQPVKELASDLKKYLHPKDKVVVSILGAFSAPYYTDHPVAILYGKKEVAASLRMKERVYAMVDQATIAYLKEQRESYYLISRHAQGYLISNRAMPK